MTETIHEIGSDAPLLMPNVLLQLYMPRENTQHMREYKITGHSSSVRWEAGEHDSGFGPVPQSLPYGSIPRIVFSYITTYAFKYQTLEVDLGRSPAELMHLMGIQPDTRRYKILRSQLLALASSNIQLSQSGRTRTIVPIESIEIWPEKGRILADDRHIRLNKDFFEELNGLAACLDISAMDKIFKSPLALDLYVLLRNYIHMKVLPIRLSWTALRNQLYPHGSSIPIKEGLKTAMAQDKTIWTDLGAKLTATGIRLNPVRDSDRNVT